MRYLMVVDWAELEKSPYWHCITFFWKFHESKPAPNIPRSEEAFFMFVVKSFGLSIFLRRISIGSTPFASENN
jgi:hypothetical protein